MIEIKRRLEFDAGHRVRGHEGKCKHLHGHRYVVELYCTAATLDDIGRVVDFSVLKSVVGKWIDDNLDHKTMLHMADDKLIKAMCEAGFAKSIVQIPYNPTAENIAKLIFEQAAELLQHHEIQVTRVVVHETPNCSAEFKPDESQ